MKRLYIGLGIGVAMLTLAFGGYTFVTLPEFLAGDDVLTVLDNVSF